LSNKFVQAFAVLFLVFVLSKNAIYFPAFLRAMVTGHNQASTYLPPGHDFSVLRSYLIPVPVAGYYTDRYDRNFWNSDEASRIYQQAQYALAPTLLDVENTFSYPYVIFECNYTGCGEALMRAHNLEPLITVNGTITLTHRARTKP